jgi:hypothetical protein
MAAMTVALARPLVGKLAGGLASKGAAEIPAAPRLGYEAMPESGPIKTGTSNFGMKSGPGTVKDAEFSMGSRPVADTGPLSKEGLGKTTKFTMPYDGPPRRLTGPSREEHDAGIRAAIQLLRRAGYGGA